MISTPFDKAQSFNYHNHDICFSLFWRFIRPSNSFLLEFGLDTHVSSYFCSSLDCSFVSTHNYCIPIRIKYSTKLPSSHRKLNSDEMSWSWRLSDLSCDIFARKSSDEKGKPSDDFTHESIHYLQQQECLVVPFYFFYMFEESFRAIVFCRGYDKAYEEISFEREAYKYEKEYEKYKRNRKCCAWLSFCKLQLN